MTDYRTQNTHPEKEPSSSCTPGASPTRPADPELVAALVPLFELLIQIDRRVKREERERLDSGEQSPQEDESEHGA